MPETINWPKLTLASAPQPPRIAFPHRCCRCSCSLAAEQRSPTGLTCCGSSRSVTATCSGRRAGCSGASSRLFCADISHFVRDIFRSQARPSTTILPSDHTLVIAGQEVNLSLKPVLRIVSIGGSLVIAFLTGGAMAAQWQTLALWWYAPRGGVPWLTRFLAAARLLSLHPSGMATHPGMAVDA